MVGVTRRQHRAGFAPRVVAAGGIAGDRRWPAAVEIVPTENRSTVPSQTTFAPVASRGSRCHWPVRAVLAECRTAS
jgi:hypothetical protein